MTTPTKPCISCRIPIPHAEMSTSGRCHGCEKIFRRQMNKMNGELTKEQRDSGIRGLGDSVTEPPDDPVKELDKKDLEAEQQARFDKKQEAKREAASREMSRRHLLPYVKRFMPEYEAGWVHADICKRLEEFAAAVERKESPRLMLFVPPRHGKQVADTTPVLTPEGWKNHGDLAAGDYVFHPSGRAVEVTAVSDKTPSDYLVELTNGDTIRCHGNHEWTVYNRSYGEYQIKETRWFTSTTKFGKEREVVSGGRCMYQMPDVALLEFPEAEQSVNPYTLGAWLGDGSRGKGCITHDKRDIAVIERVKLDGYAVSCVCTHKTTGVDTTYFSGPRPGVIGALLKDLRLLGVADDKFIPEQYIYASKEQRLQLLAGLVDTDGHVEQKTGRVRFTSADKKLADGVYELCTTLGFRPYITVEQPKLSSSGIQGVREYYVVGFQPTVEIPTVLDRKKCLTKSLRRRYGIKSVSCSPNGEQGHCIEVDSDDGLYLVGRNLTPTHNSELSSRNFPSWYLGRNPTHEIIQASYASDLALDFSKKVRERMKSPLYKNLFETRLDAKSQALERWNTSKGGTYAAVGVRGPITGRGAHCFPAGTMVSTPSGAVDIADLTPGMRVLTSDISNGELKTSRVVATHNHEKNRLVGIKTTSGRWVRSTLDHRFYVPAKGWVEARDLLIGDELNAISNEDSLLLEPDTVFSVEFLSTPSQRVYDIQVETTSCFFADEILVHNCGIIDDPVKDRQDAESQTLRQQIKDWYSSTFYTRLAPGGGVLVIMTRWHEDDLAGWLVNIMNQAEKEANETGEWPEDADRWDIIRYPAIAEEDETYRKKGEALHPDRYPIKALRKIKRTLIDRDWVALYQQRPSAEDGDLFKREYFRFYDHKDRPPLDELSIYVAWDQALGKKEENDYTVGLIVGIDRKGQIWVLHRLRGKWTSLEIIELMFDVQQEWRPILQGVEGSMIEMSIEPVLLKMAEERRIHMPYEKLKHRGMDKVARSQTIRTRVQQGKVLIPNESDTPWVSEFIDELLKFPNGVHDDQVDAFAWIGRMLLDFAPVPEVKEDKTPKWMRRLRSGTKKPSAGAMGA